MGYMENPFKQNDISRRHFLSILGAGGLSFILGGCQPQSLPFKSIRFLEKAKQSFPFMGLATSLPEEYRYEAWVEGKLPVNLLGTLYRNGPGLFDRGGYRKRALLDGDGMIQAFSFHGTGVRFQNKFVRTKKYVEESAAGKFLYPSWSTQAPGGVWANFWAFGKMIGQASISVIFWRRKLFAFDESSLPYELNPETLETVGPTNLGVPDKNVLFAGHYKLDEHNGDWLHFGLEYGRKVTLHLIVFSKNGKIKRYRKMTLPRYVYMHDFLVSERYLIFILHPVEMAIAGFLLGQKSMAECLHWRPQSGNLVMILNRENDANPVLINTDASFMWHGINAHEQGGEIIVDFVGYENPDHFIGPNPLVFAVMTGEKGEAHFKGEIRRYVIDPEKNKLRQEIVGSGGYEWPFINPIHRCHPYRVGYLAKAAEGEFFWSIIAKVDMQTGRMESYDFGQGLYCGEPVFVPEPGMGYQHEDSKEPGWLLTEVYNSHTNKSFLAILRADQVADGPLAQVHLSHHVPFSLHGYWHSQI